MRFTKQEEKEGTEAGTGRGLGSGLDMGCQKQQRSWAGSRWHVCAVAGGSFQRVGGEDRFRPQYRVQGAHYPARYSQDKLRG